MSCGHNSLHMLLESIFWHSSSLNWSILANCKKKKISLPSFFPNPLSCCSQNYVSKMKVGSYNSPMCEIFPWLPSTLWKVLHIFLFLPAILHPRLVNFFRSPWCQAPPCLLQVRVLFTLAFGMLFLSDLTLALLACRSSVHSLQVCLRRFSTEHRCCASHSTLYFSSALLVSYLFLFLPAVRLVVGWQGSSVFSLLNLHT